ncbi:MAG: TetR/AcrR family transcriptional regulator [Hyphomonadaceae bacterium]|nr:TetR/AcrR family transcriptional regulator [Hyphomonadaceae bacterium]
MRRTWRRRAEARPDEILTAALDEFIACGFDAARMEDIAARAGVTKGAIYLYFEGKEALLRALIEREVAPFAERLEAAADAGLADPAGTLRQLAQIINVVIGQSRIFAIPILVVSISNRFPDLAQHYRERVVARGRAALERLIRRGVELGQFRSVDPAAAARAMMGPIMFEMIWTHALKGPGGRDGAWLANHFDILLNGISRQEDP